MAGNHNSGKRPTPLAVYAAEGRRPATQLRSVPRDDSTPTKPDQLNDDEEWMWNHVITTRSAWVSAADAPQLRAMCELWSLYRASVKVARRKPADRDARISVTQYHNRFDRIATRFGLTPMDRARDSSIDAVVSEDKAEKYLA